MGKVTTESSQVENSSELPLFVKNHDMVGWNSDSGSDLSFEFEDTYSWEESPFSISPMKKSVVDPTDSGLGSAESLSPLSSDFKNDMAMEDGKNNNLENASEPSSVLLNMLGMMDNEDSWSSDEPPMKLSRKDEIYDISTSLSKSASSSSSEQASDLISKSLRNLIGAADNVRSGKRTQKRTPNKRTLSAKSCNESSSISSGIIPSFTEEATLGEHELQNGKDNLEHLQSTLKAIFRGVEQSTSGENTEKNCIGTVVPTQPSNNHSFTQETGQSSNITLPLFTRKSPSSNFTRKNVSVKRPTLCASFPSRLKDGSMELRILSQPEEQHRARYLTEGSRGAIKDRRGTGFPTVKLFGYNKPVILQVFIGTDQGRIQPHLFYQASQVCGKNSTPCIQKKIDGATVLEIKMLPEKDMTVSCDCVGILKERNVDVEQRLLKFGGTRSKKRSTRCRIVFRVSVSIVENVIETLQVASASILCTQPPGVPEICRVSLSSCSVKGEAEIFIIGKNFLKDTKVVVREIAKDSKNDTAGNSGDIVMWETEVEPEKEYLQPTHLICWMPPYCKLDVVVPVKVQLCVQSGDKLSEPYPFTYVPLSSAVIQQNMSLLPQDLPVGVSASAVKINEQFAQSGTVPTIIQVPVLTTSIAKTLPSPQDLIVIPSTTANVVSPGHSSTSSALHMEPSMLGGCTETLGGCSNPAQLQLIVVQPSTPLMPSAAVTANTTNVPEPRNRQKNTEIALNSSVVDNSPLLFDHNIPACSAADNSDAAEEPSGENLTEANNAVITQNSAFAIAQDSKPASVHLENHCIQNSEKSSSLLLPTWEDVASNAAAPCNNNERKAQVPFMGFSSGDKDQEQCTSQTLRALLLQRHENPASASMTASNSLRTETSASFHSDSSLMLNSSQATSSITTSEGSHVPENDGSSHSVFPQKASSALEESYHPYSSSSGKEDSDGKIYSFDQENTAFLSTVTKMCFNKENKSGNTDNVLNEALFHSLSDNTGKCEDTEERTISNNPSLHLVPNFISPGKELHTKRNNSIGIQNSSCENINAEVKDSTFPAIKKESKDIACTSQELPDMQSNADHISAMTLLPEMELLSMINPSTFDNV